MFPDIDHVVLDFGPSTVMSFNIALGLIIFGVSLDLTLDDFRRVFMVNSQGHRSVARAPIIGLVGQFVALPLFTFLLISLFDFRTSIALGMILVAACPGGNVSNFITHIGKGNVALSMTMTAFSTAAAVIMTPLNIWLYSSMSPRLSEKLAEFNFRLNPLETAANIALFLLFPLILGMITSMKLPKVAHALRGFFKYFSMIIFFAIIGIALKKNWEPFTQFLGQVFLVVLLQNAAGLLLGYGASKAAGLNVRDTRAVTVEVGMQNTLLALIMAVSESFPAELRGGAMMVAAVWGIWHNISGLILGTTWNRIGLPASEVAAYTEEEAHLSEL